MAGEAGQQEPGATGHTASTLRKQREMHAGAQLTPFDSAQRTVSCTTTVGLSEAHISSGQGHRLQRESIMPMLPLHSLERK